MSLIKTASKEKLPKGFSYPLGAAAISAALEGIPQLDNILMWFSWRDEFWVSRWRKRLQAKGPLTLMRVAYSDYFGRWDVHVYSVPSNYTIFARETLRTELPSARARLSAPRPPTSISITLTLREAEANKITGATTGSDERLF